MIKGSWVGDPRRRIDPKKQIKEVRKKHLKMLEGDWHSHDFIIYVKGIVYGLQIAEDLIEK